MKGNDQQFKSSRAVRAPAGSTHNDLNDLMLRNSRPGSALWRKLMEALGHESRLKDIDDLARRRFSVRLSVVLLHKSGVEELSLQRDRAEVPNACALYNALPKFRQACAACRSTTIMAALARGMTVHTCAAGVSSLTVMSGVLDGTPRVLVAAISCGFRHLPSGRTGGLGPESGLRDVTTEEEQHRIREKYDSLPALTSADVLELSQLVGEAAHLVRSTIKHRGIRRMVPKAVEVGARHTKRAGSIQDLLVAGPSAVAMSSPAPIGSGIVPIVQSLVAEWPHLAYSIKEIASVARITPNYFSALFRRQTGFTFSDYVTHHRLIYCKRLLVTTRETVHQISVESGFSDAVYFHRWFKAQTGMTPQAWRKNHRRGKQAEPARGR